MSSINPEITSFDRQATYAQSSLTQATTEIRMLRIMRMTRAKSPTFSLQSSEQLSTLWALAQADAGPPRP
jgi:hypothetical protein